MSKAFALAERHIEYVGGVGYVVNDEREFLIYGRLWLILLALWDEISDDVSTGNYPQMESSMWLAFTGDADYILTAMYG
jgi:hypothetical protein